MKKQQLPNVKFPNANFSLLTGSNLSFTITVGVPQNSPPYTYKWLLNNQVIQSATTQKYIKSGISFSDSGKYWAVVSNIYGSLSGQVASVKITGSSPVVNPPLPTGSTGTIPPQTGNTGAIPIPTGTKPPVIPSGVVSGVINGLNQNFIAGNNYNLSYTPIGFNLNESHLLWESNVADVYIGDVYNFTPVAGGTYWLQTEANLVDGRRVITDDTFTVNESVTNYIELYNPNLSTDATIKYYWSLDNDLTANKGGISLVKNGNPTIDKTSFIFPNRPNGGCISCNGISDYLSLSIPAITTNPVSLSVECMVKLKAYNQNGVGNASILRLERNWNAFVGWVADTWAGPSMQCYGGTLISNANLNNLFPLNQWNHLKFLINKNGYYVYINGVQQGTFTAANAIDTFLNSNIQLTLGQEVGYFDEVIIKWS